MRTFKEILKLSEIYIPKKVDFHENLERAWISPKGEFIDLGVMDSYNTDKYITHTIAIKKFPSLFNLKRGFEDYRNLQKLGYIRVSKHDNSVSMNKNISNKALNALFQWLDYYFKQESEIDIEIEDEYYSNLGKKEALNTILLNI
jgi:hypothetical protein